MAGALDGLVVVDLTSHLSGPYAAMMLADHGADVLKIERPDAGDDARRMPPFIEGESAPFMVWNRNKRSVVLDLKSVEGKAMLLPTGSARCTVAARRINASRRLMAI
jgi:crotonobetainyl-CoA:carnitine CoA-transferase CaiB-like acyl-CoA transferase